MMLNRPHTTPYRSFRIDACISCGSVQKTTLRAAPQALW